MKLDLVLNNANIITVDKECPRAASLAIVGEHIVGVGDKDAFAHLDVARTIDLEGLTVLPGFNDAHNHMAGFGASVNEVRLQPTVVADLAELLDAVAKRVETTPPGVWVIGTGYDDNKLSERRHPTCHELDKISPDNPVVLNHTSGHFCVLNSAAMLLAGVGVVEVPEGGVVAVDDAGKPNGLLEEQAQNLVRTLLHPRSLADLERNLEAASDVYLSEGITSCQEAGVGGILGSDEPLEVAAYQRARRSRKLRVRVTMMPTVETLHGGDHHPDDDEPFALDLGLHSGFGDDWLRFGPVKIFADGSLIGRTAAMFEDFEGEPGNNGYFQMDEERLHLLILKAHRSGWQVATHAIGDRAVSSVIDAYAEAQRRYPRAGTRHRIEHCAMTREADVQRLADLDIIPVPQARFISEIGDGMLRAVGARSGDCYRQKSFLDAGICVPGSSDRPVVLGAPLLGIHDLVNQRTASGAEFNAHEALSVEQAIESYTLSSAYAAFDEDKKGSLSVGKLADLVVLDRDLTAIDPTTIVDTTVLGTMVGGRFEYQSGALSAMLGE